MTRIDRFVTAAATVLACLTAAFAAPAGAAPPSSSPAPSAPPGPVACGAVLTAPTTLTHDLVCPDGNGLHLEPGATLDLGGHALVGPGRTVGTAVTGTGGVTVRNGTVRGWELGVTSVVGDDGGVAVSDVVIRETTGAVGAHHGRVTVERSTLADNDTGLGGWMSDSSVTDSVFLRNRIAASSDGDPASVTIERSTFVDNATAVACRTGYVLLDGSTVRGSVTGLEVQTWDCTAVVTGSTLERNGTALRSLRHWMDDGDLGPRVSGTVFRDNDVAVAATSSLVLDASTFRGNGVAVDAAGGVNQLGFSPVARVRGNTFRGNGDALRIAMRSEVGDNTAIRNAGIGIHAPGAVDLGGNVAYGNGVEPQCLGVVCAGRPRS